MIDVTFSGESIHEIRAQIHDFLGVDTAQTTRPAASTKLKDVSKPASEKVEPTRTSLTLASTPTGEPITVPSAQPSTVAPSYKDIADYVPKAVSKYGRGKIATLLEGFGAKTGRELKSEQYGEVLAKLKAEYPL